LTLLPNPCEILANVLKITNYSKLLLEEEMVPKNEEITRANIITNLQPNLSLRYPPKKHPNIIPIKTVFAIKDSYYSEIFHMFLKIGIT
jgi:hypothetical protein